MSDLLRFSEEQKFRLLVGAVTDYAIYMLDPDGRVATWNPGAERFKGYKAEEIIGQHFSRFFTPEDVAADLPGRALRLAARDGRFEAEGWRLRKDGARFWVNAVIDPIRSDDGKVIGFAKVTRDITEKKRAEDELEAAREALLQSQKLQAIGELTGGIAHDFNNLMTVIVGASDFLLKNPDLPSAKQRRYLESIADTAERATSLTQHLLSFGRRQALQPVVLDLGVRLDAFAEMVGRMLGSLINVRLQLGAKSALVEVDPTQLETALLNAAVNARDAMPGGGMLTIATSDCQHEGKAAICVAVADTGTGIPADRLSRVFEPFFTTKEVGKGTGLGLSQIHGFAQQAGGRAEIESSEGDGTTLRIILPRTDKPAAEASHEQEAPPEIPPGLCVLLVEDNLQVRDFAAELLEDLECEVITAQDGDEALRALEGRDVDLLFSDVVMPGLSGVELAREVRKTRPDLPILLATGFAGNLHEEASGSFDIVAKPYDVSSLRKAIASALAKGARTA
ncbi:MAG TPA: PAS domain S-box protein [Sphingomicrobium sp.]